MFWLQAHITHGCVVTAVHHTCVYLIHCCSPVSICGCAGLARVPMRRPCAARRRTSTWRSWRRARARCTPPSTPCCRACPVRPSRRASRSVRCAVSGRARWGCTDAARGHPCSSLVSRAAQFGRLGQALLPALSRMAPLSQHRCQRQAFVCLVEDLARPCCWVLCVDALSAVSWRCHGGRHRRPACWEEWCTCSPFCTRAGLVAWRRSIAFVAVWNREEHSA